MKYFRYVLITTLFLSLAALYSAAQEAEEPESQDPLNPDTLKGLEFRSLGPALTSGRISDLAVNPTDHSEYYVAVASGGVWKTGNAGTTWKALFDSQGSYSIGCVALDPRDPLTVWVGTGENNSQRSVSYGDGIYKSVDGGRHWKRMGLDKSEHIGMIQVDPRDSQVVFAAAQGPLWAPGGERGLYKTVDGGESWQLVLEISENTGVSEIWMDPANPDILYASAYQRRRRVWTLIDGGPESGIYKSTDSGASWRKVTNGLPKGDVGRIGLAVSPAKPQVLYAIIEAAGDSGGFYRSTDRGENWEKRNDYISSSPQYYQEIFADPLDPDRVYSMDTYMQVTEDGGKTFSKVPETFKHVDSHAMWIDPQKTDHFLVGCDGGLYETFDRGTSWGFKANLPVTQFYKVTADNEFPFYNVYGGTQDNYSLGGPSRTTNVHGVKNADWVVTKGGDGFQTQVDPKDSNIIYSESQYGGLARFDKNSGERIAIQPQPGQGEEALRWHWNAPLIISPHANTRLYFAANILFRSDDRGDSWRAVSGDLTRRIDRNQLEVMGKVWSVDSVAKNASTSFFGSIVALSESPLTEGLIYTGSDDGLLQVTHDGGNSWRKVEQFPGIPDNTYISDLATSWHRADTVYAAFDNHKNGDFKPYLLKSTDSGATWTSISGDLPERGSVHSIVEDHIQPGLLFAGTEFGVFFTLDVGSHWVQLKGGLPIIAVRDLVIQRRENDLVAGTFGRGIYILDDYTPLRHISRDALDRDSLLFPVKQTWMYVQDTPLGTRGKGFLGDSLFTAPNPPFGATFTYYLKEGLKTRKEVRQAEEKKLEKEGAKLRYPSWDELREETREDKPVILLTVRDDQGRVVRILQGPSKSGFHRVSWDLRLPASTPTQLKRQAPGPFSRSPIGPMVVPGTYQVSLGKRIDGVYSELAGPVAFGTEPLGTATLPAQDKEELFRFQHQTASLQRAVLGAVRAAGEAETRLNHLKQAIIDTPGASPELYQANIALGRRLQEIRLQLSGDQVKSSRNAPTPPSVQSRVQRVVRGHWTSTSAPTQTQRDAYTIAAQEFAPLLETLRTLIETDLKAQEDKLESLGAPWTPGRVPRWTPQ